MNDNQRRANDGYNGSRTAAEGDRVQVMGQVYGSGRRGVVVLALGSFLIVESSKGDALGTFHVSDLRVTRRAS